MFVGDIVHAGAVQFPRPDVTIAFGGRGYRWYPIEHGDRDASGASLAL